MSLPETILDEIRSSHVAAPLELRERVRAIALAEAPVPPRRRELPWRRVSLVLVPACLAVALAGALAVGLATSGKQAQESAVRRAAKQPPVVFSAAKPPNAPADSATSLSGLQPSVHGTAASGGAGSTAPVPATPGRAQLYEAELTLKVKDLSTATKRALRLTRAFGGYVRTVDYGSGAKRGTAYLVLRVPIGSVQAALVRFSALGAILDQHVSIQDVQPQLDRRFRQMQGVRDAIAKLQAKLESPALTAAQRTELENELVAGRSRLLVLQKAQTALQRTVSFATVSVDLRSAKAAAAAPGKPGRLGRALHRSAVILVDEAKVVLYVLIVGAPLFALLAIGLVALRLRRRAIESRLLSS